MLQRNKNETDISNKDKQTGGMLFFFEKQLFWRGSTESCESA
jgi:hypothetical protein